MNNRALPFGMTVHEHQLLVHMRIRVASLFAEKLTDSTLGMYETAERLLARIEALIGQGRA